MPPIEEPPSVDPMLKMMRKADVLAFASALDAVTERVREAASAYKKELREIGASFAGPQHAFTEQIPGDLDQTAKGVGVCLAEMLKFHILMSAGRCDEAVEIGDKLVRAMYKAAAMAT